MSDATHTNNESTSPAAGQEHSPPVGIFKCHKCGWTWKKGQSGSHDCEGKLFSQKEQLEEQLEKLQRAQLAGQQRRYSFSGSRSDVTRVEKRIRDVALVNRFFSQIRTAIEESKDSPEAATAVLMLLAADPVETQVLIDNIRAPRDHRYNSSY